MAVWNLNPVHLPLRSTPSLSPSGERRHSPRWVGSFMLLPGLCCPSLDGWCWLRLREIHCDSWWLRRAVGGSE